MISKRNHHLTLEAQQAALDMIKPGVTASEVDAAARNVTKSWLRRILQPPDTYRMMCMNSRIMEGNDMSLRKECASSVEPGIYIPEKLVFVSRISRLCYKDFAF